jgi:type II secretion system protein G
MVNHSILRKKFPSKKKKDGRKKDIASIKKAIALEFDQKRADLGLAFPKMKRGFPYYMAILIVLCIVGGLLSSAIFKRKGLDLTNSKKDTVREHLDNLAIALGRYRYHVGTYPTTDEGLKYLEITRMKKPKPGWMGPYVTQILPDPWGNDYVYENPGDDKDPVLYSKGPDGEADTSDDVKADASLYQKAFLDNSWADGWVPWHLRGVMWVENEGEKRMAEIRVAQALEKTSAQEGDVTARGCRSLCGGWRFCPDGENSTGVEAVLPVDWRAVSSEFYRDVAKAEFKRSFRVDKNVEGQYVALRLAAVNGSFSVKLNNTDLQVEDVGRDGYEVDMSDAIKYGEDNALSITVDASEVSAESAGIIGDVWIDVLDRRQRVVCGSQKISFTKLTPSEATMLVEKLVSFGNGSKTEVKSVSNEYQIDKPRIWSFDKPVVKNGGVGRYVIRTIAPLLPDSVLLNGRKTVVKGVLTDSSLGALGEAFSEPQARIKLQKFKDVGVNAVLFDKIKTNKRFFELCDEIGLLAFDDDDLKKLGLNRSVFIPAKGHVDDEKLALLRSSYMPGEKTLFLKPHWNWKNGEIVRVECVTDADSVNFYVNGSDAGKAEKVSGFRFAGDVVYRDGELKAIAAKSGVYYTEDVLKTSSAPEALRFYPCLAALRANDSIVLEVMLSDGYGRLKNDAVRKVEFSLEDGPGEFTGCTNDAGERGTVDLDGRRNASVKLCNGKAQVVLRRKSGSHVPIRIKVRSEGVRSAMLIVPYRFD